MVYYLTSAASVFMNGGQLVLVSLGIENVVDIPTALMFYDYISVCLIVALAAMVGPRSEKTMCLVIPIFAGIMAWFGWLHSTSPDQTFAVIAVTFLLGIAIYMTEQNREKYGIGGPGNKLTNIVYFIILFQVASGIVSGMNLFSMPGAANNMCGVTIGTTSTPWATCDSNGLIQFQQSTNSIAGSGGFLNDLASVGSLMLGAGVAIVQLLVDIALAVVAFPVVLNGIIAPIFPSLVANPLYLLFMSGIEAVLLVNLTMFAWMAYYPKLPAPEPI